MNYLKRYNYRHRMVYGKKAKRDNPNRLSRFANQMTRYPSESNRKCVASDKTYEISLARVLYIFSRLAVGNSGITGMLVQLKEHVYCRIDSIFV